MLYLVRAPTHILADSSDANDNDDFWRETIRTRRHFVECFRTTISRYFQIYRLSFESAPHWIHSIERRRGTKSRRNTVIYEWTWLLSSQKKALSRSLIIPHRAQPAQCSHPGWLLGPKKTKIWAHTLVSTFETKSRDCSLSLQTVNDFNLPKRRQLEKRHKKWLNVGRPLIHSFIQKSHICRSQCDQHTRWRYETDREWQRWKERRRKNWNAFAWQRDNK